MYEITTVYDHKALTALCRAVRKTYRRKRSLFLRILVGAFIATNAVFNGLLYWLGAFVFDFTVILTVAAAVLLLLLCFFEDDLNAWIGGGMSYGYKQETTASLDEDAYTITLPGNVGRWQYDKIQRLCETEGYFVLLLSKRHGHVFDKSGFTKGDPDAFRTYITEKTGIPVRSI